MRDRAENPTVGVGVVHQALAAPHTTRRLLRFTICVTDGPFVMDDGSSRTTTFNQAGQIRLFFSARGPF